MKKHSLLIILVAFLIVIGICACAPSSPGQTQAGSGRSIEIIPAPRYSSNSPYNVAAAHARTIAAQQEASAQNTPDYTHPGNEDACSIADCVNGDTATGDPNSSEP